MSFAAGQLRHRIAIQQKIYAGQDPDTGEIAFDWDDVWPSVPAKISPLRAGEIITSQAVNSDVSGKITIRYRNGVDPGMRMMGRCQCHLNQIFNISAPLQDEKTGREYMVFLTSQGLNEG